MANNIQVQDAMYSYFVMGFQMHMFEEDYIQTGVDLGWINEGQANALRMQFFPESLKKQGVISVDNSQVVVKNSESASESKSQSLSESQATSSSVSTSKSLSNSQSASSSTSTSESLSVSRSASQSISNSQSLSEAVKPSQSVSESVSQSESNSTK